MTDTGKKAEDAEKLQRQIAENQRRDEWQREVRTHVESLHDPDERLTFWAANTLIWGQPAPELVRFATWLQTGDPDRWHAAVLGWNWDTGLTPIWWIVNQAQCDAATALEIFYLCEPSYPYADGTEEAEILTLIRSKWERNMFPFGGIGFTLPAYVETTYQNRELDRMPTSMRRSLPGRDIEVPEAAGSGIPLHLYEE